MDSNFIITLVFVGITFGVPALTWAIVQIIKASRGDETDC